MPTMRSWHPSLHNPVAVAPSIALLLLFAGSVPALAQEPSETVPRPDTISKIANVFVAPGTVNGRAATIRLGGGGAFIWPSGIGVGLDLGYLSDATRLGAGAGLFSAGLLYEFGDRRDLRPYVRGGISGLFDGVITQELFHVGGGVTRWYGDDWGMTFDVRDHFYYTTHILEFSVGFVFR
ncbi:MAG: hypothetical protein QF681_05850 [Vicinamibacterales bacterium]|jgi:hypothetical protein|nr:hypothetical protein [Vicinamibacterales bacterium]